MAGLHNVYYRRYLLAARFNLMPEQPPLGDEAMFKNAAAINGCDGQIPGSNNKYYSCHSINDFFLTFSVDNFKDIVANLKKYSQNCLRPGQINLKYIIIPGINDNNADYTQVIAIMKMLGINELNLSRDIFLKYDLPEAGEHSKLIEAASHLVAVLHENGLRFTTINYRPDERGQIIARANKLLDVKNTSQTERSLESCRKEFLHSLFADKGYKRVALYPDGIYAQLIVDLYNKFFGVPDFEWLLFNSDSAKYGEVTSISAIYPPDAISRLHPDIIIVCSYGHGDEIYENIRHYETAGVKVVNLHREAGLLFAL